MNNRFYAFIMGCNLIASTAYAVVLPTNPQFEDHSATSSPNPVAPHPGVQTPSEKTLSSLQMTPEQANDLAKQARNLKPEQLEAIAKSFHQQLNPNDKSLNSPPKLGPAASAKPDNPSPARAETPAQKVERQSSIEDLKREQAFNSLMQEVMPMSPEQITRMHKYYDLTLQAKATPPVAPPDPQFTSTVVNLEPGSSAPVIRLSAGFVTSVLFVDSTGAPWPITAYSLGDPQNFNIQWDQKGNTLFIQSLKVYGHGNMAVRLWGLDTPVMLTLVSGQRTVDFRVDLQVGGRGPDAKPPVVDTTFNANVNPILMNILDGVPPKGSVKLRVSGGLGDAWLADSKIYFRTKLTVLSPAWLATVSSPDGTHVYELMLTPYIVATQHGKTVDIKLSGL